MPAGYVYILINQSMPGLLKVGRTFRDSRERARELHTTGVPTPFELAFEIFSLEHEDTENRFHSILEPFRVASNREFFRYPLSDAIKQLQEIVTPQKQNESTYAAESILARLKSIYPTWIRNDLIDIRIVQTGERVWLETTEEKEIGGYLKDQVIKRSDLAFIYGEESPLFNPSNEISTNANLFINELDPYGIINTTDIFNDLGYEEVQRDYNPNIIDVPNK
jgi:T5orf172 domain